MSLDKEKIKEEYKSSIDKYIPKFTGRLDRKQYLISMIILVLSAFVIVFLQEVAFLSVPLSIIFAVLLFSVLIRRLHDLNQPGWVSIGFFLPFVNIILAIYTFFWAGKEDKNKFGSRLSENTKVISYLFGE